MARTSQPDPARQVIVGVDTHKYIHVAVALDQHGARLGELSISADSKGYRELHDWAQGYGRVKTYGVEGTASYGVGLAKFLRRGSARARGEPLGSPVALPARQVRPPGPRAPRGRC